MNATAQAFAIGILGGIIIFFVLAYFGWIDKFIRWVDKH